MGKDAIAQLAMDELTRDMLRVRRVLRAAKERGDHIVADAARIELLKLHALQGRKDYSAAKSL